MRKIPKPHQVQMLEFLHEGFPAYLACAPRTGKTNPTVTYITTLTASHILIVVPTVALDVWRSELLEQGISDADITTIQGSTSSKASKAHKANKYTIISYGNLWRGYIQLADYEAYVYDEFHMCKNGDAKVTRYILDNLAVTDDKPIVGLSGTPFSKGKYLELATQLYIMYKGLYGYTDYDRYVNAYWTYDARTYKWSTSVSHRKQIMELYAYTSIRISQADIGIQGNVYNTIHCEGKLHYMSKNIAAAKATYPDDRNQLSLAMMMATAGCEYKGDGFKMNDKHKYVLDYIKTYPSEPIIIAGYYRRELEALHAVIPHSRLITGSTPAHLRAEYIKEFQNGTVQYIIGNSESISVGIDLSRADTMLMVSQGPKVAVRLQVCDRLKNMNKQSATEIISLVYRDQIDAKCLLSLEAGEDFNAILLENK